MKNYQVAAVFDNIANLMEIEGESPFKIGAYRRAAETFRSLTDNLEELAARDELRSISGVGEAIEKKTRQILQTGTCDLYDRLMARFPLTILDLFQLPGVGPRAIRALYEQLSVGSLEDLRRAATDGRIRPLPRMGAKMEERILEGIARLEARPRGIPIGRALGVAEGLVSGLERVAGVSAAVPAGDVRRFAEYCGEITLAVAADRPETLLRQVGSVTGASEVRVDGPVARGELSGWQVSCWAGEPAFFGSLLARATGSALHLEILERRAAERGLSFQGVRLLDGSGAPIETPDEETLYRLLDLPYIPPEIRETGEEVEAAGRGVLPELVCEQDLRGDLHCHTTWSDGSGSVAQMRAAAQARGLQYLAITDHSQSLSVARGLGPERLSAQSAEIDSVNAAAAGTLLLKGIEVDIKSGGELDLPDASLDALDIAVASIHSAFGLPETEMTARAVRALQCGRVHILAHPTGRLMGARDPYALDMDAVIAAAAGARCALEINCWAERLDLNAEYARRAAAAGVPLAISTDSHNPQNLPQIRLGVKVARRAWLTRAQVLNALEREELLEWLKRGV